jgi:hypothetical protein
LRASCWADSIADVDFDPSRSFLTQLEKTEPAWHRRDRRIRATARTLVRVAKATGLLEEHHSSMSHGKAKTAWDPQGKWDCALCKQKGNFNTRNKCRGCEAEAPWRQVAAPVFEPPADLPDAAKAPPYTAFPAPKWHQPGAETDGEGNSKGESDGKGKGKGPKVYSGKGGKMPSVPQTNVKALQARITELEHQAFLQKKIDTTSEEEEEVSAAYATSERECLERKVLAEKLSKYYEATKDAFGEADPRAIAGKVALDTAQEAIVTSMPLPQRTRVAQKKVEKARKAWGKLQDLHSSAVADYVCLQTKAAVLAGDVEVAKKLWLDAKEELKALVVSSTPAFEEPMLKQYVADLPADVSSKPEVMLAVSQVQRHLTKLAKVVEQSANKTREESARFLEEEEANEVEQARAEAEAEFGRLFAKYQQEAAAQAEIRKQEAALIEAAKKPVGEDKDGLPDFDLPSAAKGAQPMDVDEQQREAAEKVAEDLKRLCADSVASIVAKRYRLSPPQQSL